MNNITSQLALSNQSQLNAAQVLASGMVNRNSLSKVYNTPLTTAGAPIPSYSLLPPSLSQDNLQPSLQDISISVTVGEKKARENTSAGGPQFTERLSWTEPDLYFIHSYERQLYLAVLLNDDIYTLNLLSNTILTDDSDNPCLLYHSKVGRLSITTTMCDYDDELSYIQQRWQEKVNGRDPALCEGFFMFSKSLSYQNNILKKLVFPKNIFKIAKLHLIYQSADLVFNELRGIKKLYIPLAVTLLTEGLKKMNNGQLTPLMINELKNIYPLIFNLGNTLQQTLCHNKSF